jgi:3-oxoacyl-[acyl-carrier protein] reductase
MTNQRKRVLITGASSGVGKATAERFAREGWDVCLTARRQAELERLRSTFKGGRHLLLAGDYSDADFAAALSTLLQTEWGGLEALINCAGISQSADVIESPRGEWLRPFQVMLDGAVNVTRVAVPLMSQGGRIVHITSIHGERAEAGSSSYGMAKAALNQYCRSLALELASRGILVNAIAPGFVATPMSSAGGVNELETDWFRRNYVEGHHLPLKRAGQPEEIAGVAYFLTGPDASYITGQVLTVDGGLTITF